MARTYIQDIHNHIGKEVTIAGWVDQRRDHGKLIFMDIRDRTGIIQAVSNAKNSAVHTEAERLRPEWVVEMKGDVRRRPENMVNPDLPAGDVEVALGEITILSRAHELPFEKDETLHFDTYLDYLPLTLRTPRAKAIFKVQAVIVGAFREFLIHEGFVEFQAPKIIGEDAEGGASVFEIEYFGKTAHMAQSPQFYKQIMVGVFEKVFTVGNVFRAEKHATSRHLNEYTSLDIEFGFLRDHRDVMVLGGRLMAHIMASVREKCANEVLLLGASVPDVSDDVPSVKFRDAQKMIKERFGEDCKGELDLSPQHERWVSEYARDEYGSDFIYVTHFPMEKRPMYTFEDPDDPGYARGFDLLFRGLEINTGSQRVHEYDTLMSNMKKKGLDSEKFSFFLQAFKYGMPPHGGFGMGLERLTAQLLGIQNVKEATLFPREMNRIDGRL